LPDVGGGHRHSRPNVGPPLPARKQAAQTRLRDFILILKRGLIHDDRFAALPQPALPGTAARR
jgi:hypothetical protein